MKRKKKKSLIKENHLFEDFSVFLLALSPMFIVGFLYFVPRTPEALFIIFSITFIFLAIFFLDFSILKKIK